MFILKLDPDYDGSCPCASFNLMNCKVQVHCWRTHVEGCDCKASGIHIYPEDKQGVVNVGEVRELLLREVKTVWANCGWEAYIHAEEK